MDAGAGVGNALELLMVVAVGGMLCSALIRLRRHRIRVPVCPACRRPRSRAYPRCRNCGAPAGDDTL